MSGSHTLAGFQRAAVDHIVSRIKDPAGSRRFLLADEVGLGKTVVARGVIDALARGRRSSLKVVYLCSNTEIAEQNRPKLVDGGGTTVRRATELAVYRMPPVSEPQLFAFTPGTSMAGGTGTKWERRLMLFLFSRLAGISLSRAHRSFFRCAASEEHWRDSSRESQLASDFRGKVSVGFQDELGRALREPREPEASLLLDLKNQISNYCQENGQQRSGRNKLIGRYRGELQRVALRALEPDLLILDEVQRFKDVIDNANDPKFIASELFRRNVPVLILSATPYRMLTLQEDLQSSATEHHDDFHKTIDFLFGKDQRTPARIRTNLERFSKRLEEIDLTAPRDDDLVLLKRAIEKDLRKVVCRTERNWYLLDARKGIVERGLEQQSLPNQEELKDFFAIHRGLSAHLGGVGLVTDFWKSAPSILSFMDSGYALTKKLRDRKIRVPKRLLSSVGDPTLVDRNLRMRHLVGHSLGADGTRPLLWTRPSYVYHRDETYGADAPRKMLVFSGWRFVPTAVAAVLSDVAARRLRVATADKSQPLRFTDKWSYHVFDACYPSLALARLVDPRPCLDTPEGRSSEEVVALARAVLRKKLAECRISVAQTGSDPVWQAIARLEAIFGDGVAARMALLAWSAPEDATSGSMERHRDRFVEWFDNRTGKICISEADLNRMARIAVGSPAVCLVRSLTTAFDATEFNAARHELLQLCFGNQRAYYNRPVVQQAIRLYKKKTVRGRRRRRKPGFTERLLNYALDHHLQAVLDEHTYLLRHAVGHSNVNRVLKHYKSVWSLGRGSRRANGPSGGGEWVAIGEARETWPIHFALAFGEEKLPDHVPGEEDEKARRSEVREAFNSPFWPFVLATTSVGQEGLDFHLHCRDVFHWNLPSNPVDLEQREGRINRRDCLAVRHSIASDWPLTSLPATRARGTMNPWEVIFAHLEHSESAQRYKHGLYPHWIYECKDSSCTIGVERHVAFFEGSRDAEKYRRLKNGLALYRLVFGQANQEHLLADLEERLQSLTPECREQAQRRLCGYMLNLTPIGSAEALKHAHQEAIDLLERSGEPGVLKLLADVQDLYAQNRSELSQAAHAINELSRRISTLLKSGDFKSRAIRRSVAALVYFRNPYDQFFDRQAVGGFDDDIRVLNDAASV